MRTKILTLAVIGLLLGLSVTAQKEETNNVNVNCDTASDFRACINKHHNNIVEFRLVKSDDDIVWIMIKDEDGETLYQRRIKKHNTVELDFDLRNVPTGKYEYIIERNGDEYLKKTIEKS
jgi:hypothetical protein